MNIHRFEVPVRDFIDYYADYYSVPPKERYTAASNCVWFYETILDLPWVEFFLIPVLNELNKFEDLRDINQGDPSNYEEYDESTEYDQEVMELIKYYLDEYRMEYDIQSLDNENHMIDDDDVVFEMFLLLIAWIEMLAEYFDDCFRQEEILEIRRINSDAFVYTFV